jgi:hypothetical protein
VAHELVRLQGKSALFDPAGINLKAYQNVIIWCERFGVLISGDWRQAGSISRIREPRLA